MSDSDPDPDRAETLRRLGHIQTDLLPRIVNATVPIIRVDPKSLQIRLDRSGVLMSIAGHYFILTASHDLRARAEQKKMLYVAVRNGEHVAIPLEGSVFQDTEEEVRDVAIIELTSEQSEKVLLEKTPVDLSEIELSHYDEPGFYVTAGFPSDPKWFVLGRGAIESRILPFFGGVYDGRIESIKGLTYDPQFHIAVDFHNTALEVDTTCDIREWRDASLPFFNGMRGISGCGIWRLTADAKQVRLEAIQHRYDASNHYVLGTRVRFAIQRLLVARPDLRAVASIIYPRSE